MLLCVDDVKVRRPARIELAERALYRSTHEEPTPPLPPFFFDTVRPDQAPYHASSTEEE